MSSSLEGAALITGYGLRAIGEELLGGFFGSLLVVTYYYSRQS